MIKIILMINLCLQLFHLFFFILLFFLFLTAILSLTGLDFITSISGAATSISNVGPGLVK